ncbi:hypothetical protein [Mycobacterium sp. DL592]|uniref:hypothetical protein n=1 Tax=Mycobacterium sp. DL592 TaxID=2675524 RepID=UPI001423B800|nr:hypothetical protein [Mycobacterium sp. DL592]
MNLLTAETAAVADAPTAHGIHTVFVIPEPSLTAPAETDQDAALAEPCDVVDERADVSPNPSFHLSTQMILAVILTTVILTAVAVTAVASFAPQGFSAGT